MFPMSATYLMAAGRERVKGPNQTVGVLFTSSDGASLARVPRFGQVAISLDCSQICQDPEGSARDQRTYATFLGGEERSITLVNRIGGV